MGGSSLAWTGWLAGQEERRGSGRQEERSGSGRHEERRGSGRQEDRVSFLTHLVLARYCLWDVEAGDVEHLRNQRVLDVAEDCQ